MIAFYLRRLLLNIDSLFTRYNTGMIIMLTNYHAYVGFSYFDVLRDSQVNQGNSITHDRTKLTVGFSTVMNYALYHGNHA